MLNIFNRLIIFLFYSIIILKSPIVWSSDLEKIKKIDNVISLNEIIFLIIIKILLILLIKKQIFIF